jgi:hypothetical protein
MRLHCIDDECIIAILIRLSKLDLAKFRKACRKCRALHKLVNDAHHEQERLKRRCQIDWKILPDTASTEASSVRDFFALHREVDRAHFVLEKGVVFLPFQGYFVENGQLRAIPGLQTHKYGWFAESTPIPELQTTFVVSHNVVNRTDNFIWINWAHPDCFLSVERVPPTHLTGIRRYNIIYTRKHVFGIISTAIYRYNGRIWEILHYFPSKYTHSKKRYVRAVSHPWGICIFFYSRDDLRRLRHVLLYDWRTERFQEIHCTRQSPYFHCASMRIFCIQGNITFAPYDCDIRRGVYSLVLSRIGEVVHGMWVYTSYSNQLLDTPVHSEGYVAYCSPTSMHLFSTLSEKMQLVVSPVATNTPSSSYASLLEG